ncbi:MAG: hypothetical protein R3228_16260, partial [Halioglobus sp.]|nr:hypothetical protein [Halioglobus sp.]
MIVWRVLRNLSLVFFLVTVTGCKLAVIVVEGGEVQSVASGTCLAGAICIHEIVADDFSETFTAVPQPGWEFVRWNSGGDFFCKDSTNTSCTLSNEGTAAIPAIAAIIASEATYYIMPIFQQVSLPITDTVFADGREWAQPVLFLGVP